MPEEEPGSSHWARKAPNGGAPAASRAMFRGHSHPRQARLNWAAASGVRCRRLKSLESLRSSVQAPEEPPDFGAGVRCKAIDVLEERGAVRSVPQEHRALQQQQLGTYMLPPRGRSPESMCDFDCLDRYAASTRSPRLLAAASAAALAQAIASRTAGGPRPLLRARLAAPNGRRLRAHAPVRTSRPPPGTPAARGWRQPRLQTSPEPKGRRQKGLKLLSCCRPAPSRTEALSCTTASRPRRPPPWEYKRGGYGLR